MEAHHTLLRVLSKLQGSGPASLNWGKVFYGGKGEVEVKEGQEEVEMEQTLPPCPNYPLGLGDSEESHWGHLATKQSKGA